MPRGKKSSFPKGAVSTFIILILAASIGIQIIGKLSLFYPLGLLLMAALIFIRLHLTIRLPRFIPHLANLWVALFLLGIIFTYPFFSKNPTAPLLNDTWFFDGLLRYKYIVYFLGGGLSTLISWHYLRAMIYNTHKRNLFPSIGPMMICVFSSIGICFLPYLLKPLELHFFSDIPQDPYHLSWSLIAALIGSVISALAISALDR